MLGSLFLLYIVCPMSRSLRVAPYLRPPAGAPSHVIAEQEAKSFTLPSFLEEFKKGVRRGDRVDRPDYPDHISGYSGHIPGRIDHEFGRYETRAKVQKTYWNEARQALVDEAYVKLDATGDGVVTLKDIDVLYDVDDGAWDDESAKELAALKHFMDMFDSGGERGDGTVTRQEFEDYYKVHVSAFLPDDDMFMDVVRRSWLYDDAAERHEGKDTQDHFGAGVGDIRGLDKLGADGQNLEPDEEPDDPNAVSMKFAGVDNADHFGDGLGDIRKAVDQVTADGRNVAAEEPADGDTGTTMKFAGRDNQDHFGESMGDVRGLDKIGPDGTNVDPSK